MLCGVAPMCDDHAVARLDIETRKIQADAKQTIIVVRGDLDMGTDSQLRVAVRAELAAPGLTTLGLDLGEVTFLDSSGVTALLDIRKDANDRGIGLELVAVSQRVARVLTIVGLAEAFGIPADPDTVPGHSSDDEP